MYYRLIKYVPKIIKHNYREQFYCIYDFCDYNANKLLRQNFYLKNVYKNKTCFLLATGESLMGLDLSILKDEITFGIGFIFLHPEIIINSINIYFDSEPIVNFYDEKNTNWPENLMPSNYNKAILFYEMINKNTNKDSIIFFNVKNKKFIDSTKLFEDKKVHYVKSLNKLDGKIDKEIDITKRFFGGGGSIYNSIVIAMYLGFNKIILLGAGYTYKPTYEKHFYDNFVFPIEKNKNELEILCEDKISIYRFNGDKNIFVKGFRQINNENRIILSRNLSDDFYHNHFLLNKLAIKNNVEILNIVPDGFESPIYKSVSWECIKNRVIEQSI